MRWDDKHSSPDLIDRRGAGGGGGGGGIGALLMFLPMLMRSPLGWLVILAAVGYFVCTGMRGGGGDVATKDNKPGSGEAAKGGGPAADREARFVGFVLDDAQNTWTKLFEEKGETYPRAKLVLFTDRTQTACGTGAAATGPFYCPRDSRVYIDLGFWDDLSNKLGAKGEFAQAYVIAHEVGHHVQNVLGTSDKAGSHAKGAEAGSVRLELQADCYAGIWAHSTKQRDLLENGDIESALNAAQSIGDDRLQKMQKGTVRPESFTHGSSEQRMRWFKKGYETGRMQDCDTFAASSL